MDLIKKIEQDIKDYVRSLNTPDNEVYKQNEVLILSCFSKCLEIIEQSHKLSVVRPASASGSEGEPLPAEGQDEANTCAGFGSCEGTGKWCACEYAENFKHNGCA